MLFDRLDCSGAVSVDATAWIPIKLMLNNITIRYIISLYTFLANDVVGIEQSITCQCDWNTWTFKSMVVLDLILKITDHLSFGIKLNPQETFLQKFQTLLK
jgi:hypothetical protein